MGSDCGPVGAAALRPPGSASQPRLEAQQAAQRRAEREAEQEARRQAVAYNTELGAAVLRKLAKVRGDEPVLQILTAVLHGQLDQIAPRGARYGFPGWPQESQTKTGKPKVEYQTATEAGGRAREFLAGAKTTADIAGRSIALLVSAHYAQEACVARSNQAAYTLRPGGYDYGPARGLPWFSPSWRRSRRSACPSTSPPTCPRRASRPSASRPVSAPRRPTRSCAAACRP